MLYSSLPCANAHPGSMICALEEKWEAWSHHETKEMRPQTKKKFNKNKMLKPIISE